MNYPHPTPTILMHQCITVLVRLVLVLHTPKDVTVCWMMSAHSFSCGSVITSGGAKRMMFFCGLVT